MSVDLSGLANAVDDACGEIDRLRAINAEMLAALRAIVEHEQIDGIDGGRIRYEFDFNSPLGKQARAAIANAEGQS